MSNYQDQQEAWQYEDIDIQLSINVQSSSYRGEAQPVRRSYVAPPQTLQVQGTAHQGVHQQMYMAAVQHQHYDVRRLDSAGYAIQVDFAGDMQQTALRPSLSEYGATQHTYIPLLHAAAPPVEEVYTDSDEESVRAGPDWRTLGGESARRQTYDASAQASYRDEIENRRRADRQEIEADQRAMQRRYAEDQRDLQRYGNEMNQRIARLEAGAIINQAQQDARSVELQALRAENDRLARERMLDSDQHRREIAELSRAQAVQPSSSALRDTLAMRNTLEDIRRQQLSKNDVEQIVQDRVAGRLQDLASKQDIEAAGQRVQNAINQLPASSTNTRLTQTFPENTTAASSRSGKQRIVEAALPYSSLAQPDQGMMLDGPDTATKASMTRLPSTNAGSTKTRPLPTTGMRLLKPADGCSMAPSADPRQSAVFDSDLNVRYAKRDVEQAPGSKEESKPKRNSMTMKTIMPSSSHTKARLPAITDSLPDAASKISSRYRSKASDGKRQTLPMIEEGKQADELGRGIVKHGGIVSPPMPLSRLVSSSDLVSGSRIRTSSHSRVSKLGLAAEPSDQATDEITPIIEEAPTVVSRPGKHRRSSSSTSRASASSPAAIRPYTQRLLTSPPLALTRTDAEIDSTRELYQPSQAAHDALPDDFPDRASQISIWQRGVSRDLGSSSRAPRIISGPSGQQLVRSRKSKKSSKE